MASKTFSGVRANFIKNPKAACADYGKTGVSARLVKAVLNCLAVHVGRELDFQGRQPDHHLLPQQAYCIGGSQ